MMRLWIAVACLATSGTSFAAAPKPALQPIHSDEQMASFRGISQVAQQSCSMPALSGWTLSGSAGGEVKLNPPFLVRLLAAAGVHLKADVAAQKWSGLLQQDAVAAFAASKECSARLFVAMVNLLPRVDSAGVLLPKAQRPEVIYRTINQTTNTTATTEANVGNTNGSGIQNNNAGPATNFNAPVAFSGGSQYNTYFYPPVTADEKQKARDALVEEMKQLAYYPEANPVPQGPTVIQRSFRFNAPRTLYLILTKYQDDVVKKVPFGEDLLIYKRSYYAFEQGARAFDEMAMPKIGALSKAELTQAWPEYLRYCVLREDGVEKDAIKANWGSSGFVNFDTGELVFQALKNDPQLGASFPTYANSTNVYTTAANQILAHYREQ